MGNVLSLAVLLPYCLHYITFALASLLERYSRTPRHVVRSGDERVNFSTLLNSLFTTGVNSTV